MKPDHTFKVPEPRRPQGSNGSRAGARKRDSSGNPVQPSKDSHRESESVREDEHDESHSDSEQSTYTQDYIETVMSFKENFEAEISLREKIKEEYIEERNNVIKSFHEGINEVDKLFHIMFTLGVRDEQEEMDEFTKAFNGIKQLQSEMMKLADFFGNVQHEIYEMLQD